ncbi:hypothetical protein KCP73_12555 [Salmonella enterica subsp. enterica]|nr:hypothetical protein KCP73_12555 [Salmonella enterica subsp. enterica]
MLTACYANVPRWALFCDGALRPNRPHRRTGDGRDDYVTFAPLELRELVVRVKIFCGARSGPPHAAKMPVKNCYMFPVTART